MALANTVVACRDLLLLLRSERERERESGRPDAREESIVKSAVISTRLGTYLCGLGSGVGRPTKYLPLG